MKEKYKKHLKAICAIIIGTIVGVATYMLFLYFNIAIFGWNLGLIFAPLVAGYSETYIAKKLCKETTGAISAFVLFIITVLYGFILNNPTLGFNLITVGSLFIIIQAAIPISINYFIIISSISIITYLSKIFYKLKKENIIINDINQNNFLFLTIDKFEDGKIEKYLGYFENSEFINYYKNLDDDELLKLIKKHEHDALLKLAKIIKKEGGNAIIDMSIEFKNMSSKKIYCQIIVKGYGVKLKDTNHFESYY